MTDLNTTIRGYIETDLLRGGTVTDDENLLSSGRLDSLAVMSLVAFLETEFNIAIPFDEVLIENFESVDALSSFVVSKQAAT